MQILSFIYIVVLTERENEGGKSPVSKSCSCLCEIRAKWGENANKLLITQKIRFTWLKRKNGETTECLRRKWRERVLNIRPVQE